MVPGGIVGCASSFGSALISTTATRSRTPLVHEVRRLRGAGRRQQARLPVGRLAGSVMTYQMNSARGWSSPQCPWPPPGSSPGSQGSRRSCARPASSRTRTPWPTPFRRVTGERSSWRNRSLHVADAHARRLERRCERRLRAPVRVVPPAVDVAAGVVLGELRLHLGDVRAGVRDRRRTPRRVFIVERPHCARGPSPGRAVDRCTVNKIAPEQGKG